MLARDCKWVSHACRNSYKTLHKHPKKINAHMTNSSHNGKHVPDVWKHLKLLQSRQTVSHFPQIKTKLEQRFGKWGVLQPAGGAVQQRLTSSSATNQWKQRENVKSGKMFLFNFSWKTHLHLNAIIKTRALHCFGGGWRGGHDSEYWKHKHAC